MGKLIQTIALIMALLPSATLAQDVETALHFAAVSGDAEAVTALLNAGADASAQTENSSTAFDLAKEYNQEKLKGTDAWWRLNDAHHKSKEAFRKRVSCWFILK